MSNSATAVFDWHWDSTPVPIPYDIRGEGPPVVLLPALSTVSSREELAPLAALLAGEFRTVTPDWPGFGRAPAPRLRHAPDLHIAFLAAFTAAVLGQPAAVIAAGHAAGYALALARKRPGVWSRIVLVAPTWRGPLPTMMGRYAPLQRRVEALIRAPAIGPALYTLNVSPPMVGAMYRRHVYADASRVTPAFVAAKSALARRRGGRFGSAAFVTGALDVVRDRDAFLTLASQPAPILVLYGDATPPRSLAEMTALTELRGVASHCVPAGSLGLYEELPEAVAAAALPFLRGG